MNKNKHMETSYTVFMGWATFYNANLLVNTLIIWSQIPNCQHFILFFPISNYSLHWRKLSFGCYWGLNIPAHPWETSTLSRSYLPSESKPGKLSSMAQLLRGHTCAPCGGQFLTGFTPLSCTITPLCVRVTLIRIKQHLERIIVATPQRPAEQGRPFP